MLIDNSKNGRLPWCPAGLWVAKPSYFGVVRIDIGVALHILNARFLARVTWLPCSFHLFIDICCKEIVHITVVFLSNKHCLFLSNNIRSMDSYC